MENQQLRHRLVNVTALASDYCSALENARECDKEEFVASMLDCLPRIYWEFADISLGDIVSLDEESYFQEYVDEDYYDSIRRHVEALLGPDDTYLETFQEDMKYSDTPIAASVAENLADIFQPLYNFISVVRDTDGGEMEAAFRQCKEDFEQYWSQTLCNVLRALNNIRYHTISSN